MKRLALLALTAALVALTAYAGPKQTPHRRDPYVGALAIDAGTGKVLFSRAAREEAYPASCTKLMTARLVLKALKSGELTLADRLVETRESCDEPASRLDLRLGESISVEQGLYALMLKSANDVAVMFAQKLAGDTGSFVARMNAEARALGMSNTVYVTPNGLPPPQKGPKSVRRRGFDRSTAEDLAKLGLAILREQPEILRYTSTFEYDLRLGEGRVSVINNHNNLLSKFRKYQSVHLAECDGLKTGYIDAGGSSIVATARRGGHRALAVVLGSRNSPTRDSEAKRLLERALDELEGSLPAKGVSP